MAKQRELTFKKYGGPRRGGRWCKKIGGKHAYFGTGSSKSDLPSYRAALAQYRVFCDTELAELHVQKMARAFYRGKLDAYREDADPEERIRFEVVDGQVKHVDLGETEAEVNGLDPDDDRHEPTLTDLLLMIERQARRDASTSPSKPKGAATIGTHIDRWLAAEKLRMSADGNSENSYIAKEQGIKTLRSFVASSAFGDPEEVEQLLSGYRSLLMRRLEEGRFKGNTVNDKLKFLRQFVRWCYQRRVLKEMPRVMEAVVKQVKVEKGGKPLSQDEVKSLWEHADDRMRCWIALALNCGFKNRDIAEMRTHEIVEGRLLAMRHKTDVPMNVKLWPVTLELLARTRQDGNNQNRLFVNKEGSPVTRDRSDNLGSAFRALASRAGVKATFQQLRDTGAEFVRSWSRKQKIADQSVVQLYLAHKDGSTARYYLSNDPRDVQAEVLDEATDALERSLEITSAVTSLKVQIPQVN